MTREQRAREVAENVVADHLDNPSFFPSDLRDAIQQALLAFDAKDPTPLVAALERMAKYVPPAHADPIEKGVSEAYRLVARAALEQWNKNDGGVKT